MSQHVCFTLSGLLIRQATTTTPNTAFVIYFKTAVPMLCRVAIIGAKQYTCCLNIVFRYLDEIYCMILPGLFTSAHVQVGMQYIQPSRPRPASEPSIGAAASVACEAFLHRKISASSAESRGMLAGGTIVRAAGDTSVGSAGLLPEPFPPLSGIPSQGQEAEEVDSATETPSRLSIAVAKAGAIRSNH
ncbi:unnamed protein product [Schistocephalus solidus]|uniref:Uncharacterized protein n=1 Tax=Schistocephalus solidus TaxID=70667 RepID=A0A183TK82_SCHSO|nr:unnamed protein product [Schistocephalus solidus]